LRGWKWRRRRGVQVQSHISPDEHDQAARIGLRLRPPHGMLIHHFTA
jgi:hypothetical protein